MPARIEQTRSHAFVLFANWGWDTVLERVPHGRRYAILVRVDRDARLFGL